MKIIFKKWINSTEQVLVILRSFNLADFSLAFVVKMSTMFSKQIGSNLIYWFYIGWYIKLLLL